MNSHLCDRFTKNSNTPTDNNKHSIQKERNSKIIYEDNSPQEIENKNEYKNENKNENGSNECTGRDLETKEEKGRNMKNDCSKTTNNKESKNVLPNVPSWESSIWPEIKRKIFATLEAAQTSIVHRPGTFEFLGYDILIDANGVPWILEVSPSVRVYLSPSVRVYSSLSVCLSVFESVCLSACLIFGSVYLSVFVCVCFFYPCVYLSIYLFSFLSACQSVCPSACLSVCLSVCQSVCLWSVCLSVCVGIFLCISVLQTKDGYLSVS